MGTDPDLGVTRTTYYRDSRIHTLTHPTARPGVGPNPVTATHSYDPAGRLAQIRHADVPG